MDLDFIHKQRLFANPIRIDFYLAFIFDLLLALNIWLIFLDFGDLSAFDSDQPIVTTSPWVFTLFTGVGIYGIRVAMYIAIIRRNRAPQVLEWMATLVGLGFAAICMLFGGLILQGYAKLHGYDRCPAVSLDRRADAVFARPPTPCPDKPISLRR
jgi:hypothetical protein